MVKKYPILSCHSIEQVKIILKNFFEKLTSAAPHVIGIYFEPFGFQTGAQTTETKRHRDFMSDRGFNENSYECLPASEALGNLSIRQVPVELYDHQQDNPTSLAVRDNAKNA